MNQMLSLIRGLGTAGAASNAQAELEVAHDQERRAALLVERVSRRDQPVSPRRSEVVARAA